MRLLDLSALPETVTKPATRIGHSTDGRPLYLAEPGWEPTTAFELSLGGNWIEARREFPPASPEGGANPRAEVLDPVPEPAPEPDEAPGA